MNLVRGLVALLAAVVVGPVVAGDFDGSRRLICATVEARECVSGADCEQGLPDDFGAPAFIRIDFERKVMVGPQRTTPIVVLEKGEKQLLLMGTELGFGWTFALDQTDGRFSAALTHLNGVLTLFGSCTTP